MVPEGWRHGSLGELVELRLGATPARKSAEFWAVTPGEGHPWVAIGDLGDRKWIASTSEAITDAGVAQSSVKLNPAGTTLVSFKLSLGKAGRAAVPLYTNEAIVGLLPCNGAVEDDFLYYAVPTAVSRSTGASQAVKGLTLNKSKLAALDLLVPPLPEQRKIASILSSVDQAVAATQKVIEQTVRVKQGLLQTLTTRGIGHTRFKQTEIGEIPEKWRLLRLRDAVEATYPSQNLEDNAPYRPVVIRRRHRGVECPVEKTGSSILVKKQFKAISGLFAISKRQIIHGACGLVPDSFPRNAIVSKEYLQLRSKSDLRLPFLDLISRTPLFRRIIERCTYGVDREKFVLNERWFFREVIPSPPVHEQDLIVEIFTAVEDALAGHTEHFSQLQTLKRGLLQDLLTGRVRVTPD